MSRGSEVTNSIMNDLTLSLGRKFDYSLHVNRVLHSKSRV